jgi:adenylyltransferase/sulfurtransferase
MNDEQLLRYSRQILLAEIDIEGQEKLLAASVFIAGLGGLGSPVALYLAAAGVGRLTLADFDRVDLSNLQRQIIHETQDIGRLKVESAKERLRRLNPAVEVLTMAGRLERDRLVEAVAGTDVAVDASDNFPTRFALNTACLEAGKPLISGAAIRFEGQVTVFHPGQGDSPCYACLYPDLEEPPETCTQTGVAAPLPGIIGSIQAMEAMKVLIGVGGTLEGRLLRLDALKMEWTSTRLRKDPACQVCGKR